MLIAKIFKKNYQKSIGHVKVKNNFVSQSAFCMKQEKDYIQDIAAIRSMMERSSKFLSLSGWSGVLAGVYALIGAGVVYLSPKQEMSYANFINGTFLIAMCVLILATITAIFFAQKKAMKHNERVWNSVSRQMLLNMAIPLITGGILMLIILVDASHIIKGTTRLWMEAPISLIFYGLALFNGGTYTFKEIRVLGLIQITLGLLSFYFIDYSLILWAFGFGIMHIVYGAYIHFKYER